ncbi:hypothetical protein E4U13_004226 [Claviceps humidiphila]|uniref:Acyl-coenzyme A diphosphatase SCS3 n=1 Tax=Claviceps humidiphila TaxID=1294629 RepID=A0A9P7PYU7_9HYPO|nr:hypothetical protein E4U13_004226 [Claviceps humidiphila]
MVMTRRGANLGASPPDQANKTAHESAPPRHSPFLPAPVERLLLALFPIILVFGTLFSAVSPQTRSAPYDAITQSHSQDPNLAPSYFARKSNIFNILFVKRGWGWTTFAFYFFLLTHPSGGSGGLDLTPRRLRAILRWAAVTGWWFLVTQWFFGAPLIDRGFRWTGGRCDLVQQEVRMGDAGVGDVLTAVACKASGGRWSGGHDISGHVFLLVLGISFLVQEIGWTVGRWASRSMEERCVIMYDGAVKGANVVAETEAGQGRGNYSLGIGGKTAVAIAALQSWMLLMTAIYFHTWFEKLTGLLTALIGIYVVYVVPRFVPAVRGVIGLPGM